MWKQDTLKILYFYDYFENKLANSFGLSRGTVYLNEYPVGAEGLHVPNGLFSFYI